MRGVGFEPTTSQSDLRKSKRKKNVRRGNRTHDLQAVNESTEKRKEKKCEAWKSNPRPLGNEGEKNERKEM